MKRHLRTVIGIVLSVLLLGWVLRDVSAAEVVREIRHADPLLFFVSILISLLGFVFRAVRWGVLLLPMGLRTPLRPRFGSVMIGFAANNLLPARIGEFARAFSLSRLTPVPLVAAVATLVVERLFDGLVLVSLLFAAMAAPSFPSVGSVGGLDLQSAARVLAVVMIVMGSLLGVLVILPESSTRAAERLTGLFLPTAIRRPLLDALRSFIHGLAVLRHGRLFVLSLLLAYAQWLFTAFSYLLGFWAFGIREVTLPGAIFMQSLVSLAVSVPSSPGFFGPFEAATKLGLSLWSVGAEKAVSFAVGYHLAGFLPVTLIGIYYGWRLNVSWKDVRQSEDEVEDASARPVAPGGMLRDDG